MLCNVCLRLVPGCEMASVSAALQSDQALNRKKGRTCAAGLAAWNRQQEGGAFLPVMVNNVCADKF